MKRLITSALPYVNNKPHLGNLVGSVLPADIFARFSRNQGKRVLYICGSDEHGTPITVTAKKMGKSYKEVCDMFYENHKKLYNWFNISFDVFSRTSNPSHHEMTIEIFNEIYRNNYISERTEKVFFCEKDGIFLPDRYVEGKCPVCGGIARGDQCDCGYVLKSPLELKDPYCVFCKSKPVIKETKQLFFDYNKLELPLQNWIASREKDWNPLTVSIAKSWLERGLKPRSITRDMDWGVKVPLPGFENKVFYVWFDAPIGYISFVNDAVGNVVDWWGKKSDAKIYHFLGKDNIPFHTIFWPATLIAAGKYKLPDYVVGLSYLTFNGGKASKSKGTGISCEDALNSGLPADVWRFYLSNILPLTGDTNWSDEDFLQFTNNILVSNISNLCYRVMTFAQRNYDLLPNPTFEAIDKDYLTRRSELISKYEREMDNLRLREGLKTAIEFASLANKYFQEKAPWQEKDNKTTVYLSLNLCMDLALLLEPFIPDFSQKVFNLFGVEKPYLINYLDINYFILKPGFPIPQTKIPMFFTKIEPRKAEIKPKEETKPKEAAKAKREVKVEVAKKANKVTKAAVREAVTKNIVTKKAAVKKAPVKKAVAKKAITKKAAIKKAPVKKAAKQKTKKTVAKRVAIKKVTKQKIKKTTVKKAIKKGVRKASQIRKRQLKKAVVKTAVKKKAVKVKAKVKVRSRPKPKKGAKTSYKKQAPKK